MLVASGGSWPCQGVRFLTMLPLPRVLPSPGDDHGVAGLESPPSAIPSLLPWGLLSQLSLGLVFPL